MMAFIRLIRPINLLIIVITMVGVLLFLQNIIGFEVLKLKLDIFLLILSTVMIAAAGNIINDYFDVRADRINKPEKLIITKHMKRRWAIVTHWALNTTAFLIGVYLSFKYDTLLFAFIHLISINLLWFYSMVLKRKVLTGNLIIAFLTSLIPILSLYFYVYAFNTENSDLTQMQLFNSEFALIHLLAVFAFIQNLSREIVKDIQDMKGDLLIYVRSLPIVFGVEKSLWIAAVLLLILPSGLIAALVSPQLHLNLLIDHSIFYAAAIFNLVAMVLLIMNSGKYPLINNLIKISMLLGILSLYQSVFL